MSTTPIRLTEFSHGAGCGCKLAPKVLDEILKSNEAFPDDKRLLVGTSARDDAAVYDLGDSHALISTTDFFMPIVDDAFTFGRIASANALSDVYAMGGVPTLAIAILGWPVAKIPPQVAREVVAGARAVCLEAGIVIAGGHSIDNPEPLFGLAVTGLAPIRNIKRNDTARAGDVLFLTKPLGGGMLTTAEKKGALDPADIGVAAGWMTQLNAVGAKLGALRQVTALTDVTGFGLAGHLCEMCGSGNITAEIEFEKLPLMTNLNRYIDREIFPGGTARNFESYGAKLSPLTPGQKAILCDPQTSGGLLIAVAPDGVERVREVLDAHGLGAFSKAIGGFIPAPSSVAVRVV